MCGILVRLAGAPGAAAADADNPGRLRGPEETRAAETAGGHRLTFFRLAINGLDAASGQPLTRGAPGRAAHLVCNGEVYNFRDLYGEMGAQPATGSDCEVILHCYERYGLDAALAMLDGVFAFVLVDEDAGTVSAAACPFGVRPLYAAYAAGGALDAPRGPRRPVGFASELKGAAAAFPGCDIAQVPPGTRLVLGPGGACEARRFHSVYGIPQSPALGDFGAACAAVRAALVAAVRKRVLGTSDRPVACLLSGGLDSSLVAALACRLARGAGLPPPETFSIGLEGSPDLAAAREVAAHIGSRHTEVLVTEAEMLAAIPRVVYVAESYDTTTVRASVGNYLVAAHIAAHSAAKVVLNGDGSDEVAGGYLYEHRAPDALAFDADCRRLLAEIHRYDVIRSDRCISDCGLEPRTPFLDRHFVATYLSVPAALRRPNRAGGIPEKWLLRSAFEGDLLPAAVLWRPKEAFSDGVSAAARSWSAVIAEHAERVAPPAGEPPRHLPPATAEQRWYRALFAGHFGERHAAVNNRAMWMPRFVDAADASARTWGLDPPAA